MGKAVVRSLFAIVSNITPPIALSVIIGQGIAGSDFWETAVEALKMGFPMFVLPFAFIYNDALLYPSGMTPVAFLLVLVGFVALSVAMTGQVQDRIRLPLRFGFLLVGLGVVFAPAVLIQVALGGAVLLALAYAADVDTFSLLRASRS